MTKKLTIEQKDGMIVCKYRGTDDQIININANALKKADPIVLANYIAELLCDAINLKNAACDLHDLNDTHSYNGTAFEYINN